MILSRRGILSGLASMLAAPAIVHAGTLMPVKVISPAWSDAQWIRFKDGTPRAQSLCGEVHYMITHLSSSVSPSDVTGEYEIGVGRYDPETLTVTRGLHKGDIWLVGNALLTPSE